MKISRFYFFSLCLLFFITSGCLQKTQNNIPLKTVDYVDLNRYTGVWYEIANYPTRFQRGCFETVAIYTLRPDGKIDVENRCKIHKKDGSKKEVYIKGIAWVTDTKTNSKLKVRFFWPFSGDYWIIELDKDYQYAVVGHPKRKYLWILSRSPVMKKKIYLDLLEKIKTHNYDINRIVITKQAVLE